MSEKILVTGGAGFIGSHLVERLVKDHQVICIDNFDPYYDPKVKRKNIEHLRGDKNFKLMKIDVRDKKSLEKIFKGGVDKVAHLAAKAGVRASIENPSAYMEVNVGGTLNLLELSRIYNVKNFIYASTSSVYGNNKKIPFSESDPVNNPISPYASTKRSAELMCYTYHHLYDMPVTCLRFFTVYGPRGRPDMAMYKFTSLIDQGKPIEMYGDGTSKRDYTYITDVVDGITNALKKRFDFEIFNLGNSKTVELRYMISLIEKNLGKRAKVERKPEQPGDVPATWADISKSKRLLGYKPKVSIEEGVKRLVDWYKKNKS
ncbi:MAG: NAD-dependent epimerase/dehydratase family protein [Candidatus Aenigmarchaeota archaeon]|nr:NAD-dependent epimerase/dehydratase family protein [Candidatus Aenigmarchaeota archaeon]